MQHNVTGLVAGEKYFFKIAAVNGAGVGAYSRMANKVAGGMFLLKYLIGKK